MVRFSLAGLLFVACLLLLFCGVTTASPGQDLSSLRQPHGRIFYLYRKNVNVNTEAHKLKARELIIGGRDYQLALAELDLVLGVDSKDAEAYLLRGLVYTEMDKFDEAEQDYRNALMLEPDNPTFYYYRGMNYLLHKVPGKTTYGNFALIGDYAIVEYNIQQAIAMFNKALAIENGYINAIVGIGDACYTAGLARNTTNKDKWLRKSIDYYNKVLVLFRDNDVVKAKKEMAEEALLRLLEEETEKRRQEEIRIRIG